MIPQTIGKGTKYKSHSFSASAEIAEVRQDLNQVDILYTDSEGLQWVAKNYNLAALIDGFRNKVHYVPETETNNISVL